MVFTRPMRLHKCSAGLPGPFNLARAAQPGPLCVSLSLWPRGGRKEGKEERKRPPHHTPPHSPKPKPPLAPSSPSPPPSPPNRTLASGGATVDRRPATGEETPDGGQASGARSQAPGRAGRRQASAPLGEAATVPAVLTKSRGTSSVAPSQSVMLDDEIRDN